ncbi:uncharacterized protein LOC127263797 [Andrographis paniculata]|uniref:uncharacterized protein LOC127263797 n=1 Tax=Andrographis paniculata TaxID=175694 RepID=UPI0021E93582|nr:uncharacterized protein LOC127263797 [Andrographis paniculata]
METEQVISKGMKVKIPPGPVLSPTSGSGVTSGGGGLTRQGSISKHNSCLCSPTTHLGSFRCRLHRSPTLQRSKSLDSPTCQDSQGKGAPPAADVPAQNKAVNAQ